ncbi:glycosyltransferase [Kitasatospora aureofaciens]|uniref:glycosyltransferase n=1 Tax=Kitasatospora aureofaciens TaxID=1894 RepID=UPI0036F49F37
MRIDVIAPRSPWFDPGDLDGRGLGGNEATLVLWRRELLQRGVDVRVYLGAEAPPGPTEPGWQALAGYPGPAGADVVVAFRDAAPLSDLPPGPLGVLFTGDRVTPGLAELAASGRCDLALVGSLAAWERYSPALRPRHGFHVDNLGHALPDPGTVARRRYQCVHMAAPYRGLAHLLALWPRIRERVPQAELVVLGGYELWGYPAEEARALTVGEVPRLAAPPEGVRHLGAVDRLSYARAVRESELMLYPTGYEEMCCISALESCALGTVPVLSAVAALRERVVPDATGVLVEGDITSGEVRDRFVAEVCSLLLDEGRLARLSAATARAAARHTVGQVIDRLLQRIASCR